MALDSARRSRWLPLTLLVVVVVAVRWSLGGDLGDSGGGDRGVITEGPTTDVRPPTPPAPADPGEPAPLAAPVIASPPDPPAADPATDGAGCRLLLSVTDDVSRRPVTTCSVRLRPVRGDGAEVPLCADTCADARGRYEFTGLAAGDWRVRVTAPDMAPAEEAVQLVAGERALLQIDLRGELALRGRVVDERGRPSADVHVGLHDSPLGERVPVSAGEYWATMVFAHGPYAELDALEVRSAVTDTDGRFAFESLSPGPWSLRAMRTPLHDVIGAPVWAAATGDEHLIVLPTGIEFVGQVLLPTGLDPPHSRVFLRPVERPLLAHRTELDDDGAFALPGLRDEPFEVFLGLQTECGTSDLHIQHGDLGPRLQAMGTSAPGGAEPRVFDLRDRAGARLRVRLEAAGAPAVDWRVRLTHAGGGRQALICLVRTDEDGVGDFGYLFPGTVDVWAAPRGADERRLGRAMTIPSGGGPVDRGPVHGDPLGGGAVEWRFPVDD